jgi:hypothetical protein
MALTVQELIQQLSYQDPHAIVHFAYNYGDYWHTTVAPEVCAVEEGFVKESAYHGMPRLRDLDDVYNEDGERDADAQRVVIIS